MRGFPSSYRKSHALPLNDEPRYLLTSPPYSGVVLDFYRTSRTESYSFPGSRLVQGAFRGIPVYIDVPDECLNHAWRFRTNNGGVEVCMGLPPRGKGAGSASYAFVYHLAIDGTPYALRGHCTHDLRQRAARHFRERISGGGGINPLLVQHARAYYERYGEPARVTMHVLWKGSNRCYARGHLEAVEQCFVEAALQQGLPLMNIVCPFAGTPQFMDGPGPWDEVCLRELQSDPCPIVQSWASRVLAHGWTPLQRGGLPRLPVELPFGDRIDWEPFDFHVQPW